MDVWDLYNMAYYLVRLRRILDGACTKRELLRRGVRVCSGCVARSLTTQPETGAEGVAGDAQRPAGREGEARAPLAKSERTFSEGGPSESGGAAVYVTRGVDAEGGTGTEQPT